MNLLRTNVSPTEDEIGDSDGGDVMGGGTRMGAGKGTTRGDNSSESIE